MNLELLGKTEKHLSRWNDSLVHKECIAALEVLRKSARSLGVELAIASSFRSYERQKLIWNEKATGVRPLLDENSNPLDLSNMSESEVLFAILKWSAIPGFSRHHWGTDFDIYDLKALPAEYRLRLIPSEYDENGLFSKLTEWFDSLENSDFIRPYAKDGNGVSYEPWHISHTAVSKKYECLLTLDTFTQQIQESDILLKEEILKNCKKVFYNYVMNES